MIVKKNLVDGPNGFMQIGNSVIENLLLVQENVVRRDEFSNAGTINLNALNVPNLETTANLADGGFTFGFD